MLRRSYLPCNDGIPPLIVSNPLLCRPFTHEPIIMIANDGVTDFSPGSPRSVQIHSPILDDTNQQSESTSNDSFHTADSEESGSQSNPIDVDTFEAPAPPHPSTIHQLMHRRTRSIATATQCTMCGRFGHNSTECIWRGPIICEYCKESGMLETDAPNCVETSDDTIPYTSFASYATDRATRSTDAYSTRSDPSQRNIPFLPNTHIQNVQMIKSGILGR
jgi:hypothetical protein